MNYFSHAMKPGEYAFFMGTGQQATMAGGSTGGAGQEAPPPDESTTSELSTHLKPHAS
jgi:hypothetical protein